MLVSGVAEVVGDGDGEGDRDGDGDGEADRDGDGEGEADREGEGEGEGERDVGEGDREGPLMGGPVAVVSCPPPDPETRAAVNRPPAAMTPITMPKASPWRDRGLGGGEGNTGGGILVPARALTGGSLAPPAASHR